MTDHRLSTAILLALLLAGCSRPAPRADEPHHDDAPSESGRVELSDSAVRNAGLELYTVRAVEGAMTSTAIDAPGQVEADPSRMAFVSSRAAGRLERLAAVIGDRVQSGQVVAWVSSPAFVTAQQDYQLALRREATVKLTADSTGARALRLAAEERLRLLGLEEAAIRALAQDGASAPLLPVTAPFAGSLVEGLTLAGAAVEPGTPIFRLIDLRELDIAADVAESQLPLLRIGQQAQVTIPAYPELRLTGRVERIKDELDPTTRTIEALIHVHNPNGVLRPGMFARVAVEGGARTASATTAAVTIPASALLSEAGEHFVFVATGSNVFERREVRLAGEAARYGGIGSASVVVEEGLQAGEQVVARGAFILKSELAKPGLGDDH